MAKSLTLTVEACINSGDIYDEATLIQDLEGEVVKVKSGAYESQIMGGITHAAVTGPRRGRASS